MDTLKVILNRVKKDTLNNVKKEKATIKVKHKPKNYVINYKRSS